MEETVSKQGILYPPYVPFLNHRYLLLGAQDNSQVDEVNTSTKSLDEEIDSNIKERVGDSSTIISEIDAGEIKERIIACKAGIHFFFNFLSAAEFSDFINDKALWTLKSFKEYLKKTLIELNSSLENDAQSSTSEPYAAKIFLIFRELNAIVGTANISESDLDLSKDSDKVLSLISLRLMPFMNSYYRKRKI